MTHQLWIVRRKSPELLAVFVSALNMMSLDHDLANVAAALASALHTRTGRHFSVASP